MNTIPDTIVIPEFISNNPLYLRAAQFAHGHHDSVGQVRKGSGIAYIVHPLEVAELVHAYAHEFGYQTDWIDVAVVAALLHDTIEDTNCTYNMIEHEFGVVVRDTVFWLTNVTTKANGNRRVRKDLETVRLAQAPGRAKFIKCCDSISNGRGILADKLDTAQLFLTEKMALLDGFAYHNKLYKGVEDSTKLDKRMLAKCRSVLVELLDSVSRA